MPPVPAFLDRSGGLPTKFKPGEPKKADARANSVIEYAKTVRNWPMLLEAIEQKMDELEELVRWWQENVRRAGNQAINSELNYLTLEQAEYQTGFSQVQISRIGKRLKDRNAFRLALFGAAYKKALAEKTDQRGASGTGENEWYTPAEYIEMAREVLGGIDVDPASSEAAQERVQAIGYFTRADDGLAHEWLGRIWLNPPYAQPAIAQFVSKMVAECRAGNVDAAIMLTHNYTDTAWFHEAMTEATAVCFTRGRIKFEDAEGNKAAPTQGQAFFYFGDDVETFTLHFQEIGFVVVPA